MSNPCIFFDRDGIVNEPPDPERYVLGVDRFHVLPAFLEALRVVNRRGYAAVIVTNQQGVSRGVLAEETLQAIHDRLRAILSDEGLTLLDLYTCPHGGGHPDRKPNPGMLLRAAAEHDLDLSRSWMIGDRESDILAGHAAGCLGTLRVAPPPVETAAEVWLPTINALPQWLEQHLPPSGDTGHETGS